MGGQCRNILPAAFSVLTDRREVRAEKANGNIILHWPTNSGNNSFIALLTNPNNFIEKIDPTQLNSPAESLNLHVNSLPLCWSLEIKFYLSWVIKLKYSVEIDVYSSQTTVIEVLNELFSPFRPQQNYDQQYGFSDPWGSQYGSRLDWSRDEFSQLLYENPGPKPVLFVSKAIRKMTAQIKLDIPYSSFKRRPLINAKWKS